MRIIEKNFGIGHSRDAEARRVITIINGVPTTAVNMILASLMMISSIMMLGRNRGGELATKKNLFNKNKQSRERLQRKNTIN